MFPVIKNNEKSLNFEFSIFKDVKSLFLILWRNIRKHGLYIGCRVKSNQGFLLNGKPESLHFFSISLGVFKKLFLEDCNPVPCTLLRFSLNRLELVFILLFLMAEFYLDLYISSVLRVIPVLWQVNSLFLYSCYNASIIPFYENQSVHLRHRPSY